jgi:glucose-1-phosphate thymidylyltransferase
VMRKAVILARGLGRRMRAASSQAHLSPSQEAVAETGLKAMMPFKRPFLDYSLSALADAGFEEACLVIGAEHDAVRTYYVVTAPPKRVRVCFALQAEPLGTANAVLAAEEFADNEDFLAINSDNYYPASALRMLRSLQEPSVALFTANSLIGGGISPERISQFAICSITSDGYLAGIVEKPAAAVQISADRDSLVSLNCWRFPPSIFDACRRTPISSRGEHELPTAVEMAMRDLGVHFRVVVCEEPPLDLSSRTDVASVAQKIMSMTSNP